jgi:hypothetical protein
VWPVLVVVPAVDAEHLLEMASAENQNPVEAVGANRPHPALSEGVRVRGLDRRADHLDALRPEDLVEGVAELRVAIVDEEPERLLVAQLHDEVARLLDPVGFRNCVSARASSVGHHFESVDRVLPVDQRSACLDRPCAPGA